MSNQNQNPGQQNQNPSQKPGQQQQGGGQKPGQQQQDPSRQGQNPATGSLVRSWTKREQESPAARRDFSCTVVPRAGPTPCPWHGSLLTQVMGPGCDDGRR